MKEKPKEKTIFTESARVDGIKKFLSEFKDKDGNYKYIEKIDTLTGSNLMIDLYDLFNYERESKDDFLIWEYFTKQTKQAIKLSKRAVKEVYGVRYGSDQANSLDINIIIDKSELDISVSQGIKKEFVNKLISLEARVTGESEVKIRINKGIWICRDGHSTESIEKPLVCDHSNCKHRDLELDKTKSDFEYYRSIYLKDFTNADHNSDTLIGEAQGDLID